jgi:ferredoxin
MTCPGAGIAQPGQCRRQGRGLPALAAGHQEHAVPRRRQRRHRTDAEGARNMRGHAGVIMNAKTAARWASPRATASRCARTSAPPTARRCWCRACAPTPWSSSASSTTGPRPSPRTRHAQPQHHRADVAGTDRRHRLGRRHRARGGPRMEGRARTCMTRYVMTIDLRRCVGCQTCTAACKNANATPPGVQWRRVLDIETGEFPDVRRSFLPWPACTAPIRRARRSARPRPPEARRRPGHHRLRRVHRLRQLRDGLSLRGALDRARAALRLRRPADRLRGDPLRPGARRWFR